MFLKTIVRLCVSYDRTLKKAILIKTRRYHSETNLYIPDVSSIVQIKKVLRQKNINIQEGHSCLLTRCPICLIGKVNEYKLYIDKATGLFVCQNCRHTGSWSTLQQFFNLKDPSSPEHVKLKATLSRTHDFADQWKKITKTCQKVSNLSESQYNEIIQDFDLPTVSSTQMAQLNCHYDTTSKTLYFPLIDLSGYISGCKTLVTNPTGEENTLPSTNCHGLIMYKEKKGKNDGTAVIVPNIEDLLAIISEKAANTVVCLPYGSKHLPLQILPILEGQKKLILWLGNDASSWDSARSFSKKLNEQRCFFVRPTNTQPRPKTAKSMDFDLKNIIQDAQPIWHKSITTFNALRSDVLSDLQNIDKVQGIKWTRFPALNRILKGHRRGEFTVLTGPTGCGKTTFMSEYSLDLAMQGVNTLWGSFEIRNVRLAKTMLQQMSGLPLEENLQSFDSYADAFEKLPIYFMTFHGQQSLPVVMEAVEHTTYVHDIAHVIIDNVQFMMGVTDESKNIDRYGRQDLIVAAFRTFATKNNCHVTLVIHPRKERVEEDLTTSSIFGGAKASQEADNVLIVQDKRLTSVRGKKYLQIAKNRYSGDLGVMNLEFDKSSLSFQQKKKPKSSNVGDAADKSSNVVDAADSSANPKDTDV